MSKTRFIEYKGLGFWVFDPGSDIFAKYLLDAAEKRYGRVTPSRLSEQMDAWRVLAVHSDIGQIMI